MRRHLPTRRDGEGRRRTLPGALPLSATVLAVVVLLLSLGWPASPTAWAHVSLVSSTPAEGENLDVVPPGVTLQFSGELDAAAGAEVTVMAPDGAALHTGTTIVSGDSLIQRLSDQGGAPGLYTLDYTGTSADGHEVTGRFGFYVGDAGTGASPADDAADAGPPGLVERSESQDEDSVGPVVVGALLVAAVLAAAAAAFWLRRRHRQTAQPQTSGVPPKARARARKAASRDRR